MHVERARDLLGTDLAALVGESYERAYADMLRVQQLTELEEILAVKWEEEEEAGGRGSPDGGLTPSSLLAGGLGGARRGRALIQEMWNGRLRGVQRNVEVWQALLRWGGGRGWGGALRGDVVGCCKRSTTPYHAGFHASSSPPCGLAPHSASPSAQLSNSCLCHPCLPASPTLPTLSTPSPSSPLCPPPACAA